MIGLFFSEVVFFAAAALIGFAAGWRLYLFLAAERSRDEAREIARLRSALSDLQVRRARNT